MSEWTQEQINTHIIVVAGDTLARHLEWLADESEAGLLTPETFAELAAKLREDLAWWENVLKINGFASPRREV